MTGTWFQELEPGTVVHHAIARTVTEADNAFFSVMTMNPQPLPLDERFAVATEFGGRIVNSLFTLSLPPAGGVGDRRRRPARPSGGR